MNALERKYLLAVERGDLSILKEILKEDFNKNCLDPLCRNALVISIDNENLDILKILIEAKVDIGDSLLYAIEQNFVEAVELLLNYQETSVTSTPSDVLEEVSSFSPDMTPLIVAAHTNNYEVIKLLLDRNICHLPDPHDPNCECDSCTKSRLEDCLRYSKSRLNSYKALASPCLMALSSTDPLLSAFELSEKLDNLARMEPEYRQDYFKIRSQCQKFAASLLDYTRTSKELEILLNYSDDSREDQQLRLDRLRLAIRCKQKAFCAHPNVQEYLTTMWYENLPGFRRSGALSQYLQVIFIGLMFPIYSLAYLIAPKSQLGRYIRRPFIKFICHSASYMAFLVVLMLASQRIEVFYDWDSVTELFSSSSRDSQNSENLSPQASLILSQVKGLVESNQHTNTETMSALFKRSMHSSPSEPDFVFVLDNYPPSNSSGATSSARGLESLGKIFEQLPASSKKRGAPPSPIEVIILVWVVSLIWAEVKQLRTLGMNYYQADMWNILDSVASAFYIGTIVLRFVSYFQSYDAIDIPREEWDAYDPTLLSEGLFAAGTIFSTLKIIYIFSLNPYLGPLQISLGRMIVDILRFSWIYILVLFSFACGLNQLLWYYADLGRHQCQNITNYNIQRFYVQMVEFENKRVQSTNSSLDMFDANNSSSGDHQYLNPAPFDASSIPSAFTGDDSCKTWRYFSNVFESLQTLFWATFGLVDLTNFDLNGIKDYTRFWALLMFGIYVFINVVVVLNILVAMMNHSYVKISKRSDIEWKFARTRLWMSYFETGSTVPPPFNLIISFKSFLYIMAATYRWILKQKIATARRIFESCINTRKFYIRNNPKTSKTKSEDIRVSHARHMSQDNDTSQDGNINLAFVDTNTCLTSKNSYRNVIKVLVRRYLVHKQQLFERKRGLTEAKLDRWAKLNAFD